MPFVGLPGEELISEASHLKRFRDAYGGTADPRELYRLQPIFIRFAPIWPRITFLLDSLVDICWNFDDSLYRLHNYCVRANDNNVSISTLDRPQDPFEYFNNLAISHDSKNSLTLLQMWLHKHESDAFFLRGHVRALLYQARGHDRRIIVAELLSRETAMLLNEVPVDVHSGFWNVRRGIAARDEMVSEALDRLQRDLERLEMQPHSPISNLPSERGLSNIDVEYGTGTIAAQNSVRNDFADESDHSRSSRVLFSPPRSPSPPISRRGRHTPFPDHLYRDGDRRRSISRDSIFSHGASSIVTWAPTEPDAFSISMKVFSASLNDWVESIAIMDTGCEGGNFISSSFLEEQLQMGAEIESDPEGEAMQFVDFAGKTDFKPMGKVKLRWYGREIKSGRRGTRTLESTDWFRVAPHLATEDGEKPFQILLGKDWLHDNEVLTYRGLRLFKSKEKKGTSILPVPSSDADELTSLRNGPVASSRASAPTATSRRSGARTAV